MGEGGYRGATRDTIAGRAMLAAVELAQGPKGEGPCAWPGCPDPWAEVDHVLARSLGGGDEPENLQGLCTFHNRAKGPGFNVGRVPARRPEPDRAGQPSRAWLG